MDPLRPDCPHELTASAKVPRTRRARLLAKLPAVLGLVLMVAAGFVIVRELHTLSLHDIGRALHAVPRQAIALGVACTLLSYFVLSFYDWLACRQLQLDVPYRRAAFAAFCSYVLSHNLGCSAVSGAAVRFRLYRNWGVCGPSIAKIIGFCSTTYLLGTLALVGSILLIEPRHLPLINAHVPVILPIAIGSLMWASVLAYLLMSLKPRTLKIRKHEVALAGFWVAIGQVVVSSADMAATALIAYVLLPHGVPIGFAAFLGIYMMSYTAGLMASVPGGLGVFDGAMLLALGPYMSTPAILSTILVFRLLYYIVPLVLAGLMFAGHELFLRGDAALGRKRARLAHARGEALPSLKLRPSRVVRESEADFSVAVGTGVVTAAGILMVVYALLPQAHGIGFFRSLIDCLLSVTGVVLVALAFGLSQRVLLAWKATIGCLIWASGLVLLHGAPVAVAGTLALVIVLIAPFSNCYYRPSRLLSEPWSVRLVAPILLWVASLAGVAIVASLHPLGAAWWRELLHAPHEADARWIIGVSVPLGLVAIGQMTWVGRLPVHPWDAGAAQRYGTLTRALAEIGPRQPSGVLFGEAKRSAIPFLRTERFVIGLGDPAGETRFCADAIWRLRDLAQMEGRRLVFIRVGEDMKTIYDDLGLSIYNDGPMGADTLCCRPQDERALRTLLRGDSRRFARRLKRGVCMDEKGLPVS